VGVGAETGVCLCRLGQFLLLTMADFAEQLMGWQDAMFGNTDGKLRLEGDDCPMTKGAQYPLMLNALWPQNFNTSSPLKQHGQHAPILHSLS
jgi:hypothetical protein